jgi:acetyl esterase/lipase
MHGPIGYLVTTILLAACTLFALAPPRPRHSSPSNRSYWFGFLLNELPFAAFYWLAASTALALSEGAAHNLVGRIALAFAAAVAAGLALILWRGLQAGPAVEAALDADLDPGWREKIAPELSVRLRRQLPLARILIAPFSLRPRDVERVVNISYGNAGKWNLLDIYRRRSHPSGCPTLVYLHGGGFHNGRKSREARALLYRLASQGWVCVSANYRLSPSARFPDHLVDAKKVIAWVRANGDTYGADPSVLFLAGSSAGGNLAATAALTVDDPRFQPGFEDADTSVSAAISLYGYYGNYDGGAGGFPSSPEAYVHPAAPPFFVAHGDRDTIVLVEDARAFVERVRSTSSNPVVYAELPGGLHTFDLFESVRFARVVDGIEAFAGHVRAATR